MQRATMNDRGDSQNRQRAPAIERRPLQFSVRGILVVVTVCCIVFAALAPAAGRAGMVCVLALLALAAVPASQMPGGIRWLVGGTAAGLAVGKLLGMALIAHAFGPVRKEEAWRVFWALSSAGPLVGGFGGLVLANFKRPVRIAAVIGAVTPLVGSAVLLAVTRGAVEGAIVGMGTTGAFGAAMGLLVGSKWDDSSAPVYLAVLLLLVAFFASCIYSGCWQ